MGVWYFIYQLLISPWVTCWVYGQGWIYGNLSVFPPHDGEGLEASVHGLKTGTALYYSVQQLFWPLKGRAVKKTCICKKTLQGSKHIPVV